MHALWRKWGGLSRGHPKASIHLGPPHFGPSDGSGPVGTGRIGMLDEQVQSAEHPVQGYQSKSLFAFVCTSFFLSSSALFVWVPPAALGFRARSGCAGGEQEGGEECFVAVELQMRVTEHVARAEKM